MGAEILVVEDNPHSLELMAYLLTANGHHVHGAATGKQALELAGREQIDLVLLDLQLPDLDGYQVMWQLRGLTLPDRVKIVAVTAVAMVGDRERTLAAGFDHYMAKPINPRTFAQEISAWLPAGCH
ncbi:response regulator [Virgisporangium aliadipatigenens]|uniref:Response regulator n=1 Tax=Virgisporangium aliadipatigenens TaxID=741659 RepID=A0A8J4DSK5_9ACTN|nr:response regulator [Virgisporangium aliadipatigenens]GIJ48266.1 response regulator [Virgisporangium aliadipatigenens]